MSDKKHIYYQRQYYFIYFINWVIDRYGTNEVLRVSDEITMPTINLASEVLIKVEAVSLNPLDISMRGK